MDCLLDMLSHIVRDRAYVVYTTVAELHQKGVEQSQLLQELSFILKIAENVYHYIYIISKI